MTKATLDRINLEQAARAGWNVKSSREAYFANMLTYRGVRPGGAMVTQHRVADRAIDFALPAWMLGVEIDGPFHQTANGIVRDADNLQRWAAEGWAIWRVDAYDEDGLIDLADRFAAVALARPSPRG